MKHTTIAISLISLLCTTAVKAHSNSIQSKTDEKIEASFDIVQTSIRLEEKSAIFSIESKGPSGKVTPPLKGALAGSAVFSYVWPTSIDPKEVGFAAKSGILALAVTIHPDFDDTPLFDENADGKLGNDGGQWHSHWVVLVPDKSCGPSALKVKDIPAGAKPKLPRTWPGLPLYIDSPGYSPIFKDNVVEVKVPVDHVGSFKGAKFDGVTAGLRVNASMHAPLLCVENVFKVASGNLSLPGRVN